MSPAQDRNEPVLGPAQRADLRAQLRDRYPWVDDPVAGPASVEAGECDRCSVEARLVTVCGPGAFVYLGARCATELGTDAWCAGHIDDAAQMLAWLDGLPPRADAVARLWWVATGEVVVDPQLLGRLQRLALAG